MLLAVQVKSTCSPSAPGIWVTAVAVVTITGRAVNYRHRRKKNTFKYINIFPYQKDQVSLLEQITVSGQNYMRAYFRPESQLLFIARLKRGAGERRVYKTQPKISLIMGFVVLTTIRPGSSAFRLGKICIL